MKIGTLLNKLKHIFYIYKPFCTVHRQKKTAKTIKACIKNNLFLKRYISDYFHFLLLQLVVL